MRHSGGWVKLWRSIWDHPVGQDDRLFRVFCWIVSRANLKPSRVVFDGKPYDLSRGQLVTSASEIGSQLGLERKCVERSIKKLEMWDTVVQQMSHHGRIITVTNFDEYQSRDDIDVAPMSHNCPTDVAQSVPQLSHGRPHSEEVKEEKKKEELSTGKSAPPPADPLDEGLARDWFAYAQEISKTVRYSAKWSDTVRQLREIDKIPLDDIRAALAFVRKDDFWRDKAVSLPSLRKRSANGLLKIENVLAKAIPAAGGKSPYRQRLEKWGAEDGGDA